MNIHEYMLMKEERKVDYDFYQESAHPDRCELILEIYELIFKTKGISKLHQAGDTLSTYRTLMKKDLINKEFARETIHNHTRHMPSFQFNHYKGNYEVIHNNYQLGNFLCMPTKTIKRNGFYHSINTERSRPDYFDFFSEYLKELKLFYNKEIKDTLLHELFAVNEEYYSQFENFNDYIESNLLQDYLSNGEIIDLKSLSFESYVIEVNKIIEKRGYRMARAIMLNYHRLEQH